MHLLNGIHHLTFLTGDMGRLIAEQCEFTVDLGVKGKRGVLSSLSSRAAFLSDPAHRIQFVYVPKHTSW